MKKFDRGTLFHIVSADDAPARGRPRKYEESGMLPEGDARASVIVKKDSWSKFKAIAYWDRKTQKDLLDEILVGYIALWEKKHGEVRITPLEEVK
jgi:hypothetical protein